MAKYMKGVPSWYNGNTEDLPYQNQLDDIDIKKNEYQKELLRKIQNKEFQTKVGTPNHLYDFSPANQDLINRPIEKAESATTSITTTQPQKKAGLLSTLLASFSKDNLKDVDTNLLGALQPKLKNWVSQKGGSATVGAVNSFGLGLPKVLTEKLTGNKETAYSLAKEENPISYTAGEIGGYLAPGIGATKALKPVTSALTKNIGSKIGKQVLEGAIVGGALDTTQGVIEGDNAKQLATRVGTGALLGAGADIGLNKLGELVPKIARNFNTNIAPTVKDNVLTRETPSINQITPTIKPQESVNANLDINTLPSKNNTVKTQYARMEQPTPKQPSIDLTAATIEPNTAMVDDDNVLFKESKFKTNTMRKAEMLQGEETQKTIDNIAAMYEVKPNEQSVARATDELARDPQSVINRIKSSESINSAEDATAAGLITNQLRQEADSTGDFTKLKDWLETVQPKVTNTAQGLQALSTWKKLTPEGALMKTQQVVGQVNREGKKLYGKNFTPVELTADEIKFINDTMKKVEGMPEGREKDLEFAKVKKAIGEKIPPTITDKVKALQRISLLLNPKTLIARNPLGNVILGGLENVKDIPGGLVDKAVSLKTGQRTTLLPSLQGVATQAKGFGKGFKETIQDAAKGVNTNPAAGQFELPDTQVFKKGVLGKLEKATNTGLELGDRPFYQAAYDDSIRQQLKINKTDKPTDAMAEKAKAYAEERTLQNTSALVEGFKKLQQGLNQVSTGNKDLGIGTFALPFTKTPANILDKAVDYSPVGSIKAISQLMSKKEFDQKKFVDRVGRSLTGSAMIMLGYDLAKDGKLTGKANKDKDVAALEKQTGKAAYSFKIGDTYRTFDWAQPAAIPLAIGADIYNEGKDRKAAVNVVSEAIKSGGTTLLSQSLLQGVQKLFGGYDLMEGIGSTISNIPTQFVPTALKSAAQLTDGTQRDTYNPNKNNALLNQLKVKVPGASKTLEPKIDTLGREVKQYQGNNSLFNVLLNPGYTTKEQATPTEKMVLDIYNETGSKVQFPRVASSSITYKTDAENSQTIQLSPKEKTALQKYIGEKTSSEFDALAKNQSFIDKSAKDKAKELQKRLTEIYNEGEEYILKGRGISEYKK
jgi:hypothetical protein